MCVTLRWDIHCATVWAFLWDALQVPGSAELSGSGGSLVLLGLLWCEGSWLRVQVGHWGVGGSGMWWLLLQVVVADGALFNTGDWELRLSGQGRWGCRRER